MSGGFDGIGWDGGDTMTLTTVLLGSASFVVVLALFLGSVGYAVLLLRSRLKGRDIAVQAPAAEPPMADSSAAYWTKGNVGDASGQGENDGVFRRTVSTGAKSEVRTSDRLENLLAYDEWCAVVERR